MQTPLINSSLVPMHFPNVVLTCFNYFDFKYAVG